MEVHQHLPETFVQIKILVQAYSGTYYRFSTGNKIAVHTAPDISGPWKFEGAALPEGSSIELSRWQGVPHPRVPLLEGYGWIRGQGRSGLYEGRRLESHDTVYGPGGQGVFDDPKLGPILYYHYVDTKVGYADGDKRLGWNTMDFSSGWPVV